MLGAVGEFFSWVQAKPSGLEAAGWIARVRGPKLAAREPGPGRAPGLGREWAGDQCGAAICRRGVYSAVLCSTPVHTQTPASKQQAAPSLRVSLSGAQL